MHSTLIEVALRVWGSAKVYPERAERLLRLRQLSSIHGISDSEIITLILTIPSIHGIYLFHSIFIFNLYIFDTLCTIHSQSLLSYPTESEFYLYLYLYILL